MKSKNNFSINRISVVLFMSLFLIQIAAAEKVVEENANTYLIDQTGERWDITQAVSIGFQPHYFEFGIGRNAFHPLGETDWSNEVVGNERNFRVIGITEGDEAHAYSVSKLYHHEIANTKLASGPIVTGY
jgi:hypothetical protein